MVEPLPNRKVREYFQATYIDLYSSILPRLDMTRISWVMPVEADKMNGQ